MLTLRCRWAEDEAKRNGCDDAEDPGTAFSLMSRSGFAERLHVLCRVQHIVSFQTQSAEGSDFHAYDSHGLASETCGWSIFAKSRVEAIE